MLAQLPDDVAKKVRAKPAAAAVVLPPNSSEEKPEFLQMEDQNDEFQKGFARGAVWQKFKSNPIAAVAIGVTVVFLGKAVVGSGGGKAAPMTINKNLQMRVKAQAFALSAIALAYYMAISQKDD